MLNNLLLLKTKFSEHVFKLKKTLYVLKQAPRAWYDQLSSFLMANDFDQGQVDTTLQKNHIIFFILVEIYVDDKIFGATNEKLCKELSKLMQNEFEMSMMGELKFFLEIQTKPKKAYIK